jgi:hypothetical protein
MSVPCKATACRSWYVTFTYPHPLPLPPHGMPPLQAQMRCGGRGNLFSCGVGPLAWVFWQWERDAIPTGRG